MQTTRTREPRRLLAAELRLRAFGTLPPVPPLTDLSTPASGQYELRSMWAKTLCGVSTTAARTTSEIAIRLIPAPRGYCLSAACAAATRAIGTR